MVRGPVEAGQDLLDDPGGQSGVEQPADLQDAVHVAFVVVAVAVGASGWATISPCSS